MERVISHVVPLLGAADNVIRRQGSIEAIACILDQCVVLSIESSLLFRMIVNCVVLIML